MKECLVSVWEQRKLGEVFEEYSEKGHKELPALTIIQGGGTLKREDSDRNLMYNESNLANYKMVHKDDFIVHLRSFEGGLEKSSLDGIISPAYHTFHSEEVDSRFYYSYFRSYEFIKHKLVPHVYGIRDGRSIDIEGMKSIEIPYTLRAEQKKIGDCWEVLDHLITLHQRKHLDLLKIRKNTWEQRKLGDVSESYSGGTPSVGNKSYYGGSIPFIRSAEINSESTELFLTEEGLTNSSARMVYKGDILYALYGATSGETGRSRINGAINQAILAILPHDGYDSEFLMQWLRKSKQNITDVYLQGGQGNLSGAIVKALDVNFPSLAEQWQIGNYFQSIDHLITLHQQK